MSLFLTLFHSPPNHPSGVTGVPLNRRPYRLNPRSGNWGMLSLPPGTLTEQSGGWWSQQQPEKISPQPEKSLHRITSDYNIFFLLILQSCFS
jgi:hypothetical protein